MPNQSQLVVYTHFSLISVASYAMQMADSEGYTFYSGEKNSSKNSAMSI